MTGDSYEHERRQWSVGQGAFQTCTFSAFGANTGVQYFYDCGSHQQAPRDAAITRYLRGSARRHFHFGVISHIDTDHVNGLIVLADAHVTIGTIFFPLLSAVERLALGAEATAHNVDERTLSIIVDPVAALSALMPNTQVLAVRRGDGPSLGVEGSVLDGPLLVSPDETVDGARIVGPIGDFDPTSNSISDRSSVILGDTTHPAWLLSFYLDEPAPGYEAKLIECLAHVLELELEEALALLDDSLFVRDMLSDTKKAKKIRDAFAAAGIPSNRHSLQMLSGPAEMERMWHSSINFAGLRIYGRNATWMMTGDAEFTSVNAVNALATHLGGRLASTSVLVLPHHGSKENFTPELLNLFRELRLALTTAGSYKNWQHPASSVVRAVAAAGVLPWVTSEFEATEVDERVVLET